MTSPTQYAALRDHVLGVIQGHEIIPIEWKDPAAKAIAQTLNLSETFFAQIFAFPQKVKANQLLTRMIEEAKSTGDPLASEGKIAYDLFGNLEAIAWLLTNGIVDEKGLPFFEIKDALLFSSKLESIVYELCWNVLICNNLTVSSKQATVGNSVGTESLETSSAQPDISNEPSGNLPLAL